MTGILVLGVVAGIGCNSESPRTSGEGDLLAAGIPGVAGANAAGQDSSPMVVRRLWGGADVDLFGRVSPDGRFMSLVDWETGNLAIREFASGEVRLVTSDGSMSEPYAYTEEGSVMSYDGRSLCYDWRDDKAEVRHELRVVGLRDSKPRTFYRDDVDALSCAAWSPDSRHVVAVQAKEDKIQLLLVSVTDGSRRLLTQWDSGWPSGWPKFVSVSPDGRYVIYDRPVGAKGARDIFVLESNGGRETALVENPADDYVLGWTPNGRHVLFASDRTGTLGAWLLTLADGEPRGEPRLVKPDLWRVRSLGFARDGSFFYGVELSALDVYVASFELTTGEVLAAPTAISGHYFGHDRVCDWSPDGRYLLYYSANLAPDGGSAYSIRSAESGETRLLVPDLKAFLYARWSPDGYALIVPGVDREDRPGVFEVDVQSGRAERLPAFDDPEIIESFGKLIDVSPDGGKVYYTKRSDDGPRIAAMDLESGRERILGNEGPGSGLDPWALSPDGEHIAFATEDGTLYRLIVMTSVGGEAREIYRHEAEASWVQSIAWSRDGKSLLYSVRGASQIWRIGTDGGAPEKIGLAAEGAPAHLSVTPDGRRIAFTGGRKGAEVWVMQDFLPSAIDGSKSGE
jgi:Tol biopolymer transport system component